LNNEVATRFSEAAKRYEQAAHIQKQSAILFDTWLAGLSLKQPNLITEIGCGTGFLSHLLQQRYTRAMLQLTDIAPGMIDYCRAGFEQSDLLQFQVCDGRTTRFSQDPDWVLSTMCFQWFDPLTPVLEHHFKHSRVIAFSILLDGSFTAWRAAHARLGLSPGLQSFQKYDALLKTCNQLRASRVNAHRFSLPEQHENGLSFAKSLRAIGADQPRLNHQPVNLRSVCKELGNGFISNYEIGFFCIEK
jgi:malonyl-CoA O-methyltransferase